MLEIVVCSPVATGILRLDRELTNMSIIDIGYLQKNYLFLEIFWGGQNTLLRGPGPPWPPHGDATAFQLDFLNDIMNQHI